MPSVSFISFSGGFALHYSGGNDVGKEMNDPDKADNINGDEQYFHPGTGQKWTLGTNTGQLL